MPDRIVTHTRKDASGEITAIGNPGQPWSPRLKADAIGDIDTGAYRYLVAWPEKQTTIRTVAGPTGKYLRTDRDETTRNNLLDLPNF